MAKKSTTRKPKHIAVLVENIYEDLEAWYPILRLREAGVKVTIVGPEKGVTYTSKHGYPVVSDMAAAKAKASMFDGVIVPGGYAPDKMRRNAHMVKLVKDIDAKGGLIASICHGPWLLCESDVLQGRHFTCVSAIKTDCINAGGVYSDHEVVVDKNLITSRTPPDLPAMMRECLKFLGTE